jgi:hypothetical protein
VRSEVQIEVSIWTSECRIPTSSYTFLQRDFRVYSEIYAANHAPSATEPRPRTMSKTSREALFGLQALS